MKEKVLEIVNELLVAKGVQGIVELNDELRLREDLGFTSFDLAELTVKIEDEFDIDVFEDGLIENIGELLTKLA